MLVCATHDLLRSLGERVDRLCLTVRALTHIADLSSGEVGKPNEAPQAPPLLGERRPSFPPHARRVAPLRFAMTLNRSRWLLGSIRTSSVIFPVPEMASSKHSSGALPMQLLKSLPTSGKINILLTRIGRVSKVTAAWRFTHVCNRKN
jgi:hypothetical protein